MPQSVIRSVSRRRPFVGAAPPPVIRARPPIISKPLRLPTRGTALILPRGRGVVRPLAILQAITFAIRTRPKSQVLRLPFSTTTTITPVDLLEAIEAWLNADAGLAALAAGGAWADEAPLFTPLPYVIITEPDGNWDNESNSASVEPVRVQVSVFAISKAQARSIRRYLKTLVQDAPLTFTAGTLLYLRAADRAGLKDPDRGPDGHDIWQEIQFFDALVGHG